ncbi:hypothetical protein [Caldimonas aquatica]|uniref:Uncharacterized protein n=1 Tax=Caldimonas aquatica TaxID=376175 RepID=A0ABY6MQA5_9BURK|nr:hypothetical protein [Schlegelella aquatica]UZD53600.1 hypothetical protein OMP39_07740 [Schlegelella aquatica]
MLNTLTLPGLRLLLARTMGCGTPAAPTTAAGHEPLGEPLALARASHGR